MNKEFAPYQPSLDMKELGFDEPCFRGWDKDVKIWYHPDSDIILDNPTFSQAFRWFREKYKLYSHIGRCMGIVKESYFVEINTLQEHLGIYDKDEEQIIFNSYEEAELECLKKLIEIVKNK